MQNAWNVMWFEEGRKLLRVFEGDSPKKSGAVDFFKLKKSDGSHPEIVSRRLAYPPPLKQSSPDVPGHLWCPYCIKWREFEVSYIERPDYYTPDLLRCSTCGISIKNYYVRKYNPLFAERYDAEQEMKKNKPLKTIPTTGGRRRRKR